MALILLKHQTKWKRQTAQMHPGTSHDIVTEPALVASQPLTSFKNRASYFDLYNLLLQSRIWESHLTI